MDDIKFLITEIKSHEDTLFKSYDVSVILNGIPLKHTIFNGCEVVPASRYDFAEFDLFTCSCGEPGCAGFHSPVIQNKTESSVCWTFPDDHSYVLEKLEYEFERPIFEKEFESLRDQMCALEKDDTYLLTCIQDSYDNFGGDELAGDRWEIKNTLSDIFAWYENRYGATQNLLNMLKENFPTAYSKKFKFEYDGKLGKNVFDLQYLVCRMLNEWPKDTQNKSYLKKAQVAASSVNKILDEQEYGLFLKLVHKSYKSFNLKPATKGNYNESIWSAFNFELYSLVEEGDFDVAKLKLILV